MKFIMHRGSMGLTSKAFKGWWSLGMLLIFKVLIQNVDRRNSGLECNFMDEV